MPQYGARIPRYWAPPRSLEAVSKPSLFPYEVYKADPAPTQREREDDEAVLEWTYTARVEPVTLQGMGWKINFSSKANTKKSHTERVTNPNDSEQFVDVEVIDVITVRDEFGRVYDLEILHTAQP
jgi:hypothetical protein